MTSCVDIQWAIKGYKATPGILGGCSSRLSFTLVAQSWDQTGCYVTWIITSTTGMDQGPVVRSIHLVSNLMFQMCKNQEKAHNGTVWGSFFFFLIKKGKTIDFFFFFSDWVCLCICIHPSTHTHARRHTNSPLMQTCKLELHTRRGKLPGAL